MPYDVKYVSYVSVWFLLPPAHISKGFESKSSPFTPWAKKYQLDIIITPSKRA